MVWKTSCFPYDLSQIYILEKKRFSIRRFIISREHFYEIMYFLLSVEILNFIKKIALIIRKYIKLRFYEGFCQQFRRSFFPCWWKMMTKASQLKSNKLRKKNTQKKATKNKEPNKWNILWIKWINWYFRVHFFHSFEILK